MVKLRQNPRSFVFGRVFRYKLSMDVSHSFSYLLPTTSKFGLKSLETGKIDNKVFSMCVHLIKRLLKKRGLVKVNISLFIPVTSKPLEARMGSGKAQRQYWECPVYKGMILVELGNLSDDDIFEVFKMISERLPVLTKIVKLVY